MHVLFLSRWFPYPADNGSKIRIFNLIRQMSTLHNVTLVTFTSEPVSQEQYTALHAICSEVYAISYRNTRPGRLGWLSAKPRSIIASHSIEMEQLVIQLCRDKHYDVVIASQLDMAPYTELIPHLPKIIEEVELTVLYERFTKQHDLIKRVRSGLTWWKLSRYVRRLVESADGCTVASSQEQMLLQRIAHAADKVQLVPNGVDIAGIDIECTVLNPHTLIYTGALSYGPNFDAIDFFLREIFPRILDKCPDATFSITGSLKGVALERLPRCRNVLFTGYLPSVNAAVAQSWVSVVPLRLGGGTRLKVLESLALGTPVIATSKGAEGLELVPGRDLLIADEPAHFAAAVLRVLGDVALREQLSRNGRQAVELRYNWQQIGQQLNCFVERQVKMQLQQTD